MGESVRTRQESCEETVSRGGEYKSIKPGPVENIVQVVCCGCDGKLKSWELGVNRVVGGIVTALEMLTLRRLMSYIYGAPILDVSRSHTTTQHSR